MDKYYPLRTSSCKGKIEVVKFLVEKGANIHADNDYAHREYSLFHIDIVKFLVENGADIHVNNDNALINASIKLKY